MVTKSNQLMGSVRVVWCVVNLARMGGARSACVRGVGGFEEWLAGSSLSITQWVLQPCVCMSNRYRLNRSAANHGRIHRDGLETLYQEFPDSFKMHDAMEHIDDWDRGTFQKLQQAGLLESEYVDRNEPKHWSLTQQAIRWLEAQQSSND